ncbi:MAG: hypothetical protein IJJ45_11445, partial [Clostridia bacterium]|nr:hypothetical protein [Clostridia bacterium]
MTAQTIRKKQYEDPYRGAGAPAMILAAVALIGLSALLTYIAVATPQQGTAMEVIRDVMRGLGGSLSVVLPLTVTWAGVLCFMSGRGRSISVFRVACDVVMIMALFAGVHVFFARRIVTERMTITSFANFVSKSYSYGEGGGALGALLGWPFYHYLGTAGGCMASLAVTVLCLTATGRLGRLAQSLSARSERVRERRAERATQRNIEQEFYNEAGAQPARRARRPAGPARDPFSEGVLGADHAQATSTAMRRQRMPANRRRAPMVGRTARPRRPEGAQAVRPVQSAPAGRT